MIANAQHHAGAGVTTFTAGSYDSLDPEIDPREALEVLARLHRSATERVESGDERAALVVEAVEALIAERQEALGSDS